MALNGAERRWVQLIGLKNFKSLPGNRRESLSLLKSWKIKKKKKERKKSRHHPRAGARSPIFRGHLLQAREGRLDTLLDIWRWTRGRTGPALRGTGSYHNRTTFLLLRLLLLFVVFIYAGCSPARPNEFIRDALFHYILYFFVRCVLFFWEEFKIQLSALLSF